MNQLRKKINNVLKSNHIFLFPNEKSSDFIRLLTKIDDCCCSYLGDQQPFRGKFGIGDAEFTTLVEKTCSRLILL